MNITVADIKRRCPRAKDAIVVPIGQAGVLPGYGITSRQRFVHFIAQCAEDSTGFTTQHEGVPRADRGNPATYLEKMYGKLAPRVTQLGIYVPACAGTSLPRMSRFGPRALLGQIEAVPFLDRRSDPASRPAKGDAGHRSSRDRRRAPAGRKPEGTGAFAP